MDKFKNQYRIPSARAPWLDYSADGCYFITICTANRKRSFGRIVVVVETHGRASLPANAPGRAFLPANAPDCASLPINAPGHASLQLSPIGEIVEREWIKSFEMRGELFCDIFVIMPNHIHAILRIQSATVETHGRASLQQCGVARRPPKSISSFVAGFKSSATKMINEYRHTPRVPVWQTRFHDHFIRNQAEYDRIFSYIQNNPDNWNKDKFYTND
jgi:REP element-mobilizing transposase RayT